MGKHRKLTREQRLKNVTKILCANKHPKDLVKWYSKKYKIDEGEAELELYEIGYYDQIQIAQYEANGIEWEYIEDGYTGTSVVAPKGTPEWELHQY